MRVLVDTNIIVRLNEPTSSLHADAVVSVTELRRRGEELVVVPQILVEFWAIATRPVSANGLGFDTTFAKEQLDQILLHFALVPDADTLFDEWQKLVVGYNVSGKTTHDARIVAAMVASTIDAILTFNVVDFRRFDPKVKILDPHTVVAKT